MEEYDRVIIINLEHFSANSSPLTSNQYMTAQNLPEQEAFQKWLFGFEKQNPFLSTFEYLYMVFHQKKIKKEEITCQNKELFNANQSKTSILTKQLNQLISRSLQNSNDIRVGKFGIFNGSVSSQVK